MSFTSLYFAIVFLPIVLIIYWLVSRWVLVQNIVLLIASLVFYSFYDVKYIILLFMSILVTFVGGYSIACVPETDHRKRKIIFAIALLLNISILLVFKYEKFVLGNLNYVLQHFGFSVTPPELLLPVGLSFFIFQSSTYLFDLYNNKIEVEKNFVRYALFVSFFPTITSGPIQRSSILLPRLRQKNSVDFTQLQNMFLVFLWGAFLKLVLSDRLKLLTDAVYGDYQSFGGVVLVVAAFAYSIQIYADFAGYSYMAIAVAGMLGIQISENFRQPYMATNIPDFWRRWHISLTSWFTDYLYIPLGGSRKGTVRRYANILIVFLVSGLWHGAAWKFVLWGGIHAVYQIVSIATRNIRRKICAVLNINVECAGHRAIQRVWVFLLTSFAWIFFRADSTNIAINYVSHMFSAFTAEPLFDRTIFNIGINPIEWNVLVLALLLLTVVSAYREAGKTAADVIKQGLVCRWACYLGLILLIAVFGIYGPSYSASAFIYAGF